MKTPVLLNVLDIYLDDENPRHEPIRDQPKIFSYLVEDEMVKPLARDISKEGLSPLELPAVMQDQDGEYIALEGNRRLCASKLLNDPEKAPESSRGYFKKLAKEAVHIPKKVRCIVFDNREEADVWLDRRHNGQQGGIGVKGWDTEQKNRRNLRNKKADQNALAQTLLDYGRDRGFLKKIEKKIVTTAARYLGNPYFRKSAGIITSRSDADVVINVSFIDFESFLEVFCNDLVEGERVSSRSNKNDWENYVRVLISEGAITSNLVSNRHLKEREKYIKEEQKTQATQATNQNRASQNNATTSSNPNNSNTNNTSNNNTQQGSTNGTSTGKPATTKVTQNPDARKYIVPQDFKPTISNKTLRRAFQELKEIQVDDHTLAVSLVTRAFLEKTYNFFHEAVQGSYLSGAQTHVVVGKVIELIAKDQNLLKAEKDALGALRNVASNKNNVLSPQILGANAHAVYYPDSRQLKREFDNISMIIQYMLQRI